MKISRTRSRTVTEQDRKIESKRGTETRTERLTEKGTDREKGQRGKHEWEEGQGI